MLIIREIHNRYHRTILEIKLEYDKKKIVVTSMCLSRSEQGKANTVWILKRQYVFKNGERRFK